MDITFSNDKVTLGASIETDGPGYAVFTLRLTENNLTKVLDQFASVIGVVEFELCNHVMGGFQAELVDSLWATYLARKTIEENLTLDVPF